MAAAVVVPLSLTLVVSLLSHVVSSKVTSGMPVGPRNLVPEAVVLGDMIFTPELHQYFFKMSVFRKGILDEYLWPRENGQPTVPYEFHNSVVEYREEILSGLAHWELFTCIKFRQKNESDINFVRFVKDNGCWSYIGLIGKAQEVSIDNGCQSLTIVVHEVGHALGLFHEQMRPDRDDYLTILWDNIGSDPDVISNFDKAIPSDVDYRGVDYDYTSIMQYFGMDFSMNGRLTMATKKPKHQGLLGKTTGLSHFDKLIVNRMYGCIDDWRKSCQVIESPCEGDLGYLDKDCTCTCPPGDTNPNCRQTVGMDDYFDYFLPSCSQVITDEGMFSSPLYPSNIPSGTWCVYTVEAPSGKVPEVIFQNFELEQLPGDASRRCQMDFLQIRDKDMYDGDVVCGWDIRVNQSFVGTSRTLYLYLNVASPNSKGFLAQVKFHKASNPPDPNNPGGCGGLQGPSWFLLVSLLLLMSSLAH